MNAEQIRAKLEADAANAATQPAPAEVAKVVSDQTGRAYFHQIPGSCFRYQVGPALLAEITFFGGMHITNDPQAIEALEAVVDRPGSMITSHRARINSMPVNQRAAAEDALQSAIAAHAKMIAAGERVA